MSTAEELMAQAKKDAEATAAALALKNKELVAAGLKEATTLEEAVQKLADLGKQNAALKSAGLHPAGKGDIVQAMKENETVAVQVPSHITAISVQGTEYKVRKDGIVMAHIRHALHIVEAFGGRIVADIKKEV